MFFRASASCSIMLNGEKIFNAVYSEYIHLGMVRVSWASLVCNLDKTRDWLQWLLSRPAMSNPNGLLSQNVCHYLDQGGTLNDILMRAAY